MLLIALIAALCLSLAVSIVLFVYLRNVKRRLELMESMQVPVVVECGSKDLHIETLKCRIIVLKPFVAMQDHATLQKYLVSRLCSEELHDFFMKNMDFIYIEQTENPYTDEVFFDIRLNMIKPDEYDRKVG